MRKRVVLEAWIRLGKPDHSFSGSANRVTAVLRRQLQGSPASWTFLVLAEPPRVAGSRSDDKHDRV